MSCDYITLPNFMGSPIKPLEKNQIRAYFNPTAQKKGGQNWHSEFKKMHSRILRGFFCARNMADSATMADCAGEPSGSPFSFLSGNANPVRSVSLLLAWKATVSKFKKETAMSKQTQSGNPPGLQPCAENTPHFPSKLCNAVLTCPDDLPFEQTILLDNLKSQVEVLQEVATAAGTEATLEDMKARTLVAFTENMLRQLWVIIIVHDELQDQYHAMKQQLEPVQGRVAA
jgi:hypothetical protein